MSLRAAGQAGDAEPRVVTPGYFETMGIGLVSGRAFDWTDSSNAPQVGVVNRTLARRLWPGSSPLGRRLQYERAAS